MTKHTPGPWTVEENRRLKESKADLLEAGVGALQWLETVANAGPHAGPMAISHPMAKLAAAIAKARGEA